MSSVDEEVQEPFKLCVDTIQGKWLCEELGVSLRVTGKTIQYASGECYPLEVSPEGKLEIFGYRGLEKKSDASSVIWKHKDTGHYLTWMYEGDNAEQEPELDASLIIQNSSGGRTTRKRKVDYVALDKELDAADAAPASSKQAIWNTLHGDMKSNQSTSSSGPSESDIADCFMDLKNQFEKWLKSTNNERFKEIVAKRGYLSTEIRIERTSKGSAASTRFVNYLKSIGAKAWDNQDGSGVNVRVPESLWKQYAGNIVTVTTNKEAIPKDNNSSTLSRVTEIKNSIADFTNSANSSEERRQHIEDLLNELEALPIDLEILKETRVGVEINKLSKSNERARKTLEKLKAVYLDSKEK